MGLFSRRNHFEKEVYKVQTETVDKDLRIRLWNVISRYYWNLADSDYFVINNIMREHYNPIYFLAKQIQEYYFNLPIDEMGNSWQSYYEKVRENFFECKWYKVYDFLEFLISTGFINICQKQRRENGVVSFESEINNALELEGAAYRLIGNTIVQISCSHEVEAVNQAMVHNPFENVRIHLETAAKLLSDRQNPDYRNSIKESISAVEAACKELTGDEKGTLGLLLRQMKEHGIYMHEAFQSSINKNVWLYKRC